MATTKLEAVNQMLALIGERPTQDISSPTRLDVVRAVSTIDEISRFVQSRGWWFNTIEDQEIAPGAGEFVLASNVTRVLRIRRGVGIGTVPQNLEKRYVARHDVGDGKLKLYDKTNRSFTGQTENLTLTLIEELDFEELPEVARRAIMTRAAVTFQVRSLGSVTVHQFGEGEAQEAWRELQRADVEWEAENEGGFNEMPLTNDLLRWR